MTGQEPGFHAPRDGPEPSAPAADPDSTIEATAPTVPYERAPAPAAPKEWPAGRIALSVAAIGLCGSALGAIWFGIAERHGVNPGGVTGAALVLVAAALLGVGLLLVVGGLGYYVLAPGFMGPEMAWRGVGSHRLVIATTILIVLLANAGPVAYTAMAGMRGLCSVPGFLTAALSVDLALLGITYFRFIRPGVLTAGDLGLTDRSRLARHVGIGLLVGVGVLVISAAIQATMRAIGVQQTQLASLECVREFPFAGFLGVLLAGGVLAPIAEELYFRGYVFRSYRLTRSPIVAYGATSLLFATLHLNLPALLPILVLSLIFCYAYQRTGSIVPSMVGHALNNSTAFCILYFTSAPLGG
ncbi:MAG TPA: CPBP family intramembrane glutamic endopeptidase [Chloroflexota bacterium]|nr:CPBP family intramembrane glutamic endopeptidase [Chloroflexota bacterium]